jgi:hypothetical protein
MSSAKHRIEAGNDALRTAAVPARPIASNRRPRPCGSGPPVWCARGEADPQALGVDHVAAAALRQTRAEPIAPDPPRGCPLFAPITGDLRWQAVHDEVERRAAAMLAAFRASAG